jgi:hypothetical protein
MRALVIAMTFAVCLLTLAGCSRWCSCAAEPPVPPQQYGQGMHSDAYNRPSYSDPHASPSGQYGRTPSSNGYDPASPSNPYGPVSGPNGYEY